MNASVAVRVEAKTIFIVVYERAEFEALPWALTIEGEKVDVKVARADDGVEIIFQFWKE